MYNRNSTPKLFCIGFGYVGQALAAVLGLDGWSNSGTSRSIKKVTDLKKKGFKAFQYNGGTNTDGCIEALANATHILVSVPPGPDGDPIIEDFRENIINHSKVKWLGYLSSTSVYGSRDGGWVDESTKVKPSNERGRQRVVAETMWLELGQQTGLPINVFRLAGIYGPGRNQLVRLKSGSARRIQKDGVVFGRIHVEDIVTVLRTSMINPNSGGIFNVADDEPSSPEEVISYAAHLLGMEPPPLERFSSASLSNIARSFYLESKRVSNKKLKSELEVRLKYPNYRIGLRSLL